jgi:hypothetical protein
MKAFLSIAMLLLLASCSKKIDRPVDHTPLNTPITSHGKTPEVCGFGLKEFNLVKRSLVSVGERPSNNNEAAVAPGGAVILLDFDGEIISGTSWTFPEGTNFAPANLTASDITEIVNRVSNDFSPFNVTVTTDNAVYNAANAVKRTRIMITESYEWFGNSMGGISFVGSFTWGDNTPGFVFSSLLYYNLKKISEAVSHEAGHTLGLLHETVYDANCNMTTEYNPGQGSGENGWAPIMGIGFYQNATLWHNGTTVYGCSTSQDEVGTIGYAVGGFKADDHANTTANATTLSNSAQGLINGTTDVDFFRLNITGQKTISALPYSVGSNNAGANVNLVLKVYDRKGKLITTINDPASLGATTTLGSGQYYLSVSTIANSFTGIYGMLGNYTITVN